MTELTPKAAYFKEIGEPASALSEEAKVAYYALAEAVWEHVLHSTNERMLDGARKYLTTALNEHFSQLPMTNLTAAGDGSITANTIQTSFIQAAKNHAPAAAQSVGSVQEAGSAESQSLKR